MKAILLVIRSLNEAAKGPSILRRHFCVCGINHRRHRLYICECVQHCVVCADVGEVLSNGTLQVTNSSSLFRRNSLATLTCSSREGGTEYTFSVLLEGI